MRLRSPERMVGSITCIFSSSIIRFVLRTIVGLLCSYASIVPSDRRSSSCRSGTTYDRVSPLRHRNIGNSCPLSRIATHIFWSAKFRSGVHRQLATTVNMSWKYYSELPRNFYIEPESSHPLYSFWPRAVSYIIAPFSSITQGNKFSFLSCNRKVDNLVGVNRGRGIRIS